jgi:hypothetical protein
MSKTILRPTLINKYFWHFCWLPYLYTFFLAEDELLFLFDTSSRKVFREENHPFMKFIPGLHTTWHMCVFHDQYTLTNDVLHIALCVDIISFLLEFSFKYIWIFQNINNKFYCDFKYYFVQYFYTSGEKIFGYEYKSRDYNSHSL